MPVDPNKSHWSLPGAIRTIKALRRLGGRATTWQIAEQTHSLCVHSDIHCVRCYCQAHGICDGDEAVRAQLVGTNETGRRIYRYQLHPAVLAAARTGLPGDAEDSAAPVRPACAGRRRQAVLFDTLLPQQP